uniref:Negative elongation factor B-like n=1 Tax=Hirondellea gigas TaxID=1518452 RepID=A0A2P2I3Z6_9CRUS
MAGFGLEEIGIPGGGYLKESLTHCTDPLKAIEEFQVENGILLPSLRPMLHLLDLHNVKRLDFHNSIMEELRDKLIGQISELGAKEGRERDRKLKELLTKSFPVIKIKALRPVVMCILKHMAHVEEKYLKILVRDRELYEACDTEVKRQIWKDSQALFGDEVSPLLTGYITSKEDTLFSVENLHNLFFSPSPKARRQGEMVQKLVHMIGRNVKLYDLVLQFLRTLFLRTRFVHYCSLRAELLMALHDKEVHDITAVDPCHKFTWCLDACIREGRVDAKRSRELQVFLDSIRRGQEQVLGDLSMILCDPYAINFLANSVIRLLHHLMNNDSMPRENSVLVLVLRMLALGLHSWDMIESQVFREPKLDPQIVTKFLPSLVSLMVDDEVRKLNSKLPLDERETAIAVIEHSGPPPDAYQAYLQESSVACVLSMHYTLHCANRRDRAGVMRVLGTLATCHQDRAFHDTFLHSLVAALIPMTDEFAMEDFCTIVFDEFFLTNISRENVMRHLMKLVWYVHTKLPDNRRDTLLKALQPGTHQSENSQTLYESLRRRVTAHQEAQVQPQPSDSTDSPLLTMPTPPPLP